jgi:hypothetical protein
MRVTERTQTARSRGNIDLFFKPYPNRTNRVIDISHAYVRTTLELGERKFHCQICLKSFGRRSVLNKHLHRVHRLAKPVQSDDARALLSLSHI